jgi:diguanylate cyclase (GGDEF)-like protein
LTLAGPNAGAVLAVEGDELVLGRGAPGLSLEDRSLSRRHARVFRGKDGFYVQDLESKNGSFLNGERIRGKNRLRDGDRLQIGLTTVFRFVLHDALEQQAAQQLYESAVRDPLTGLFNRRYLDERLAAEHSFAVRHSAYLTVMILDIDNFKTVNDGYGHDAGDAVICAVGRTLQRILRNEDLVARYGGEEFCILARAIDRKNGAIVAERCRKTIAAREVSWGDTGLSVTVSVGVATLGSDQSYPGPEALLEAAERALYRAKENGRNLVSEA